MLVLRRDGTDAALLGRHIRSSSRLDLAVVRPDALVRTPLRWPPDPRSVPLALVVLFRDRPGTVPAAERLVRHVGDVPVIGVVEHDGTVTDADGVDEQHRDLAAELIGVGVEDVIGIDQLSGPVLEQVVVAAIDRRDRGVLELAAATELSPDAVPSTTR